MIDVAFFDKVFLLDMHSTTVERVFTFCMATCAITDGVSGGEFWRKGSVSIGVMAHLNVLMQRELLTRVAKFLNVNSLRK